MDKITTSLAEKVSWRHETGSFLLLHKRHAEVESITHAYLTSHCSLLNVETKNVHSDSEKCKEYGTYGKRRRLVVQDGKLSGEKAAHVEVKSSRESKANPSSILGQNCHFLSQLNMKPVWRGSFSICNGNIGTVEGLAAHVSSKACPKVSAVARSTPASLCGELLHRNDLWPKDFDKSPPTDCDIALYFSPENESLLDGLIDQKYALKAVVGRAELLVFTSCELPVEHSRFEKKYYLWRLCTKKKASPPYQADDHLHQKHVSAKCTEHLFSATDVGAGEESNLKKASDTCSPMSPLTSGGERQGVERMKNEGPTPVQLKVKRSPITHCRNTKSMEYIINPFMYLKKKVVSETGSGVGASKQDVEKNLDLSDSMIQVEKEVEQSPEERIVNGVFTVVETNRTIAEETTENIVPAGAIHHGTDIIKKGVTVEREPKDIAEKETDKDNPGDISVDAVAIQAQLVIESTDTIANRSTEIVSSKDAIHHEDNLTKRSVTVEKETEDVDEMPMDIDTPESFVGNTNFTSDGLAEVTAPVDTNYHEKDITIRGVTMEKGPDGVSEKESPFPEHISVNSGAREVFIGNINTISNTVGAILYKDIGTTMDKASMNKDVELHQSDPVIEVQKEFEEPSRGLVNEGRAEMQNCRTIADVSTEHCTLSSTNYREKDETSVPVEKDHEGINKRGSDREYPWNIAINAGPTQDGLSITLKMHKFSLIFLFTISTLAHLCCSDPRVTKSAIICGNKTTSSVDLPSFSKNYNQAIAAVTSNASTLGASSHIGEGLTSVYAFSQCMQDLSSEDCKQCATQLVVNLDDCQPLINGTRSSRLYLDGCFLWYDDHFFMNEAIVTYDASLCGNNKVNDSSRVDFGSLTRDLFSNLTTNALTSAGFSIGSKGGGGLEVYGLVQCWEYLNSSACGTCLEIGMAKMMDTCLPSEEGRVFGPGCFMQYSNVKFYNSQESTSSTAGKGCCCLIVMLWLLIWSLCSFWCYL